MRLLVLPFALLIGLSLSACRQVASEPAWWDLEVGSRDFVFLPCGDDQSETSCALAVVGGKRILFGAPSGVSSTVRPVDLKQIDAVLVFSLRAQDIEGLDEVRNGSWHAGRDRPLLVIGPPGIESVAAGLNLAFEQADAYFVVDNGIPPGGYDAAVISTRDAILDQLVFDTGDVKIDRLASGYRVRYNATYEAILSPCGAGGGEVPEAAMQTSVTLTCAGDTPDWPLTEPRFVTNY